MTKKKVKPPQKMKALEQDPCATCLYGKNREQHNVPKRVENFNRVKPSEAFGKPNVSNAKRGVKKPKPKPKPNKPKKPKGY